MNKLAVITCVDVVWMSNIEHAFDHKFWCYKAVHFSFLQLYIGWPPLICQIIYLVIRTVSYLFLKICT